ncbi:hypothetical protein ACNJX9_35455 [Bradyrhizobium sp. DASA03076]|uniref:Uncharacterized protein n=1 Tax=Bradyrhizobium manausense TaxID=989370 RepID=A0A0R3ECJ6_9BRAD|nr:hypothetical protein [Bradyrhizobium manausense]KRQ17426.1 hypothetical protein AOQ71_01910 [Bradyrhizobium manausense]
MLTADECRDFSSHYKALAGAGDISPKRLSTLISISKSFAELAKQLELLATIASEEDRKVLPFFRHGGG